MKPEDMKINFFFKQGTDVGAVADALLDMNGGFTAFNDAREHKCTTKADLYVAKSEDVTLYTDYKSFITVEPVTEKGEELGMVLLMTLTNHDDFTLMNAEPLVIPI